MHFLITAGPTREYLDPVRFISNPSSGRMGLAVARAALRRGHRVTLILGPVQARLPKGARIIRIETAEQMAQACFDNFDRTDCLVMAAAVSDYRALRPRRTKIKKGPGQLTLRLSRTTDILAELGRARNKQLLIGFALETDQSQERAREKLKKKNLDYIVANTPASFASERIEAAIISAAGPVQILGSISKRSLALKLISLVEKHLVQTRDKQR